MNFSELERVVFPFAYSAMTEHMVKADMIA